MKTSRPIRIASVITALAFIGCEKHDEQQKTTSNTPAQQEQTQGLAAEVAELMEVAKEPSTDELEAPEDALRSLRSGHPFSAVRRL